MDFKQNYRLKSFLDGVHMESVGECKVQASCCQIRHCNILHQLHNHFPSSSNEAKNERVAMVE